MTTYQDPQPQSRRAVRQGERGETPEQQEQAPFQGQTPPQFYPDSATAREMWDTTARRAAQLPPAAAPRPDAPAATSGRRSAQPAPTAAEPLSYSTQGAPSTQQASPAPSFRPRGSSQAPEVRAEQPSATHVAPPIIPAQPEPGAFRVRDFSPEGRRSAAPQARVESPLEAQQAPPSDLDYHTEARIDRAAPPAPPIAEVPTFVSQPQPVAPELIQPPVSEAPVSQAPAAHSPVDLIPPSAPGVPVEQTLTRRELRALQQSEAVSSPDQPVWDQPVASVPAQSPFPPAPEPDVNTALTNAITEFDQLFQAQPAAPAQPTPQADAATPTWTAPVGHWSVQADLDDDEFHETTINRTVGSGSTATSALVLPTIPGGHDIRGPLTGTGEIMLTGSIELPHTLSSTGATARFDNGGIDALFDAGDAEVISTDSAPVRAIKAVSTHNSGQGVTHTQKPKGTRTLTVLLIAASSMAVVVAGLLITAFALNVF
ncbi:MAG: hypothetical protein LCH43_12555 [Actinobacteria bacterium]|nr:hypothetical protein [Actinomycetota bacterium]